MMGKARNKQLRRASWLGEKIGLRDNEVLSLALTEGVNR